MRMLSAACVDLRGSSNAILLHGRDDLLSNLVLQLLTVHFDFVLHEDVGSDA